MVCSYQHAGLSGVLIFTKRSPGWYYQPELCFAKKKLPLYSVCFLTKHVPFLHAEEMVQGDSILKGISEVFLANTNCSVLIINNIICFKHSTKNKFQARKASKSVFHFGEKCFLA